MPAERDFILRLIQMMGELVARLREMIAQGDIELAGKMLLDESRQRGVDIELARAVSGESLIQLLAPGGAASDPTRLILMGEFLYIDALREEAEGREEEARDVFAKARLLLATGSAYMTAMGSSLPGIDERIREIDDMLRH